MLFPYKFVSVLINSNSLQVCKHFTSSARRRLFRFSLFIYFMPVFYLTYFCIVWHDIIIKYGLNI